MDEIFIKYPLIKKLNVSRETCLDFEKFISMILDKNKEINIVSSENANKDVIMNRHIIDSAQIIDIVDFNYNTTCDLGTGGGFPGLVTAIVAKNMKKDIKIKLFEKSYHKSSFLVEVSRKLNLNTEVIQEDIFKTPELKSGTIMARAFKPLPVVLDLVHEKFLTYKNLIIFMGKTGKKILEETLINWELEFEAKKSISSEDSFLLNIKKIKKKNNI
jgi:16S rRNA (guanine527-N7)-methyltransferase